MGSRRAARELALQALYQVDLLDDGAADPPSLRLFWEHFDPAEDAEAQAFARELVDGVRTSIERIDGLIAGAAEHWRLPRLSRVDLNVLRLATFELIGRPEIPASVTLNEAVEIARRFGSEESAGFVNGVLDHIARQVGAPGLARGLGE
jgi:transcription antitermination protein NusB